MLFVVLEVMPIVSIYKILPTDLHHISDLIHILFYSPSLQVAPLFCLQVLLSDLIGSGNSVIEFDPAPNCVYHTRTNSRLAVIW